MASLRAQPNVISCSAVISACEKGRKWRVALAMLFSMLGLRIEPNLVSWNAATSACEPGSQWRSAIGLLHSMAWLRIHLDVGSCSVSASACEKAGQRLAVARCLFPLSRLLSLSLEDERGKRRP
eukprot:UN3675